MGAARTILHVDMDAFYAAVEQRDRPELKGKPVIVGADPKGGRGRGVVATASYEARAFGVSSAMPISQAWKRCPHGVYLHPDMAKYAAVSRQGMEALGRFSDSLAALEPGRLARKLGTHGHDLMRLARGEDDRPVIADAGEAKSLGQEHTYDQDVSDLATLRGTLLDLADSVARRLRGHGLRARTITLKYRDESFRTLTRAETGAEPTDAGDVLFRVTWRLFEAVHGERRVRLLGIYASGFGAGAQLDLFTPPASAADKVRDAVDRRFGEGTLTRASLMVYPERRHPPDRRG